MSSIYYAQLNNDNICTIVCEYGQALDNVPSNYLSITSLDSTVIGQTWNGSVWVPAVVDVAVEARAWRDMELLLTDGISGVADHPQHDAYIAYRVALRAWPSTGDFPATQPVLG